MSIEAVVTENDIELGKLFVMTYNKHDSENFDDFKNFITNIFDFKKEKILNYESSEIEIEDILTDKLHLLPSENIRVFSKMDSKKLFHNIRHLLVQKHPELLV